MTKQTFRVYPYLRASTDDQDASRARASLQEFAAKNGLTLSREFKENQSGAKLDRPALMELLATAEKGDIILIEQIDRLSRLNADDWDTLKLQIKKKGIIVVSLDLPTSQMALTQNDATAQMVAAVNAMLMDLLAITARKDYDDRRRRQVQGIAKAKEEGKYKGRPVNEELHSKILELVDGGKSQREAAKFLNVALSTVVRAVRLRKEAAEKAA